MIQSIRHFLTRDDGAITVDWVVLTAGLVVLAGGLGVTVNSGVTSASRAGSMPRTSMPRMSSPRAIRAWAGTKGAAPTTAVFLRAVLRKKIRR